jgi:hypothetical protein
MYEYDPELEKTLAETTPETANKIKKLIEGIVSEFTVKTWVIVEGKERFQMIETHDGKRLKLPLVQPNKSSNSGSVTTK